MSSLRVKAAGMLLILLALSIEFTPRLLVARVLAQQEDYEDFLGRLEGYLTDALPPESEPIEECEYVAPEGFNPSDAERLWRDLAPLISMGCPEQGLGEKLRSFYSNSILPVNVNGSTILLNLTGLRVEKPGDGSVKAKIPVISDKPLNYTHFNSTNVRILYETWNETLVKYYRVEKNTGLYHYVFKDVKYGFVFDVVSKLAVRTFPGFALERCVFFSLKPDWGWFMANPVVAVPGHYEEVRVVVPQQETGYRVLFPAYDPVYSPFSETPWVVNTNISSTSLNTGEILKIGYLAEYMPAVPVGATSLNDGGEAEPLNATLTLEVSDAFQPLGSVTRILDDDHVSGFFELQAVKQGLHNITLRLEGNACFSIWPNEQELVYTVQVVGPTSPSVSFFHTLDPSLLKHARLILELSNNGGSTARNILVEMWGEYAESASRRVGDIKVGETRREEFTIGLSKPASYLNIRVSYFDDEGNKYVAETLTSVWTNYFIVPEHYEEYTVIIPEHEETRMVFVPDSEYYTHIRLYWLTFKYQGPGLCAPLPTFNGHYSGVELDLVSHLTFTGTELNASSFGGLEAIYRGDMVMLKLEPYWEEVGVFNEKNAMGLLGIESKALMAGGAPEDYRTSIVGETWVFSKSIIMNATQFAAYNQTVSNYISENSLQDEFRIGCRRFTNATRLSEPSGETGFLTLVYHPLAVKGSGPLKSIQVKNYAGFNASYVMKVDQLSWSPQYGNPVCELYSAPLLVRSMGYNVTLASSIASEGYTYIVRLLYGSNMVAEAVFNLSPEPSPFWTGFWDGLKDQLFGILVTSTIIIVTSALTGGGTAAAYVGTAISIGATLFHLIWGSIVNIEELRQGMDTAMFLGGLADYYGNLSYRLSNYTPPKAPPPYGAPPIEVYKPFQPGGPLAELFWEESNAYRTVSAKVMFDTGLNIVFNVGISDFETAFNPNAKEYDRGYACSKIVGAVLSITSFLAATRIAAELKPKMENFKTNMWSALGSLKAWLTFALYDLIEALVKGRRTVRWLVENPGEALTMAKLTILGALEKLRGRTLEIWENTKTRIRSAVEEAESQARDEDCHRSIDDAVKRLNEVAELNGKMTEVAEHTDQWKTCELFCKLDDAGLSVEERTRILNGLDTIAEKSSEAGEGMVEWLLAAESGRLREILDSDILGGISELEESVLRDVGEAWRLNKNVGDFESLLKGLSFTVDYPAQGKGFYDLLHECVESRSLERIRFLEKGYGWIAEVRSMELEPGQKPAKIVENAFPFIRDVLNTLDGDLLNKVSEILDNLLETRGRRGAYDEMLRLKSHLFDVRNIGLGGEEPKVWLVVECLEKWDEASRLSDAVVSHQMLDARGHYTARSPVKVNYLDAGNGEVIPIIAAEGTEGGFGITIPKDVAEYLGLKDEGFVIFFKDLSQDGREIILPIKVESDGKVAITRPLERLFKAELPNDPEYSGFIQNGEINWGAFEESGILLRFKAVEPTSRMLVEKIFVITNPGGESIRIRVGEEFADKFLVFRDFEFLKAGWLVERLRELGFSDEVRHRFMKLYGSVMALKEDELYKLAGSDKGINDACGRLGEGKTALFIAEKKGGGYIVSLRHRMKLGKKVVELDIVTVNELLDTKYWNEETFRINIIDASETLFKEEVINRLKNYEAAGKELGKDKVSLVFVQGIPEDLFKLGEARIRDALGGDTSWLKIINGLSNLSWEG